MVHKHCLTWNMARTTEKPGNLDTNTVGPGKWRETLKKVKMKNTHCRTWNMAIKLTNKKNDKLKQQDLDYGEKTEKKRGK